MPARTDEAWRFANRSRRSTSRPSTRRSRSRAKCARRPACPLHAALSTIAGRMVFANDQLLTREILDDDAHRQRRALAPARTGSPSTRELFSRHFMREEAILGWTEIRRAARVAGARRHVPLRPARRGDRSAARGLSLAARRRRLVASRTRSSSLRKIAKVTVVDHFRSADANAPGLACGVNDLWLGAGAKVTYVCVQSWSRRPRRSRSTPPSSAAMPTPWRSSRTSAAPTSAAKASSHLRGPGGRSDMLAVTVAEGAQEVDQRTLADPRSPRTPRAICSTRTRSTTSRARIFSGLIRVDPGAHRTDAYQKVRNLLLSDEAEANSAPGPRDRSRRRPLHPRRHQRPDRSRGALLPPLPRHPAQKLRSTSSSSASCRKSSIASPTSAFARASPPCSSRSLWRRSAPKPRFVDS